MGVGTQLISRVEDLGKSAMTSRSQRAQEFLRRWEMKSTYLSGVDFGNDGHGIGYFCLFGIKRKRVKKIDEREKGKLSKAEESGGAKGASRWEISRMELHVSLGRRANHRLHINVVSIEPMRSMHEI